MISEPSAHYNNFDSTGGGGSNRDGTRSGRHDYIDEERHDDFNDGRKTEMRSEIDQYADENGSVFLMDVYQTRQRYGYFSILFSLAQTGILIAMMVQCGLAPLQLNPMVGPYPDALSYWGATNSYLILVEGERWRLLSPIMLHAGVFHLLGNVSVQLDAGAFFEKEWGSVVWLVVYLTGAVGASMMSTCTLPDQISVGSSGAVMALFGAKMSEVFCRCCESKKTLQGLVGHQVRKQQCWMTVGGVVLVLLMSFVPFVDWGAHVGGVLTGFCVGMIIFACYIRSLLYRLIWFVVGVVITAVGFSEGWKYLFNEVEPNQNLADVCQYMKQFEGYQDYECSCTKEDLNWGGQGN